MNRSGVFDGSKPNQQMNINFGRFSHLGSIAEREHLKWKNAVELPNNPYSAEALQRRISQTNQNRLADFERLTNKANGCSLNSALEPPMVEERPIKVVLGSRTPDPVRYIFH